MSLLRTHALISPGHMSLEVELQCQRSPKGKGVNKTRGSPTAEHMNERGDDKRERRIQVVLRKLQVFESRKPPVRKRPCSYSPHAGREQGTESGQRADPSSPARRCPLQRNAL